MATDKLLKGKGMKVVMGGQPYDGDAREGSVQSIGSGERRKQDKVSFYGGSLQNDTGNHPVDKGHSKPSL